MLKKELWYLTTVSSPKDLKTLIQDIRSSRGWQVNREIRLLKFNLNMVKYNLTDLVNELAEFQNPDSIPIIWANQGRGIPMDTAMQELTRRLTNYLSLAISMVDHVRRQRRRLYAGTEFDKEIQKQINERFTKDDDVQIAKQLREFALHYNILPAAARIDIGSGGRVISHRALLQTEALLEWGRWSPENRARLSRYGKVIDIGEFSERYFKKIEAFYLWLWRRQEEVHASDFAETSMLQALGREMNR